MDRGAYFHFVRPDIVTHVALSIQTICFTILHILALNKLKCPGMSLVWESVCKYKQAGYFARIEGIRHNHVAMLCHTFVSLGISQHFCILLGALG